MKEKKERTIILILSCLLLFLLFTYFLPQEDSDKAPKHSGDNMTEEEFLLTKAPIKNINAADLVRAMKVGWNLGNTFDSYSAESYSEEIKAKDNYLLIATYSSLPYISLDSSSKVNFTPDGYAEITWNLSELKSSDSTDYGAIGIQIFNFRIGPTGQNPLTIDIKEASLTFLDGTTTILEEFLGTQKILLELGVAKYYPSLTALSKLSTATLKEATLTIKIHITDYPAPETAPPEPIYYETLWNNPQTTYEMIAFIKQSGFGAIRIPITYRNHIDSSTFKIEENWLNRIEEVIRYAIQNDLYCIINLHHDVGSKGWLKADLKNYEENYVKFSSLWNQIAARFQNYSEYLVFEGFNEILNVKNDWANPSDEDLAVVNQLNQLFVDTVRLTGGNNSSRCLIVSTYGAAWNNKILSAFKLPADSIKDRLIVSLHTYEPRQFCLQDNQLGNEKGTSSFCAEEDSTWVERLFITLNQTFVAKNIPVIIGEFASFHKGNSIDRAEHAKCYTSLGRKYDITCFWWDSGGKESTLNTLKNTCLLNRYLLSWNFPEIVNALCTP